MYRKNHLLHSEQQGLQVQHDRPVQLDLLEQLDQYDLHDLRVSSEILDQPDQPDRLEPQVLMVQTELMVSIENHSLG